MTHLHAGPRDVRKSYSEGDGPSKLALTAKAGGIIVNHNSRQFAEAREFLRENVYLPPRVLANHPGALQGSRCNAP